jgi:ferritin-like metal-binding protein YciE
VDDNGFHGGFTIPGCARACQQNALVIIAYKLAQIVDPSLEQILATGCFPGNVSFRQSDLWRQIMAKNPKNLHDLFQNTLKDIYFAEKKLVASLPKMAKAASSSQLKKAFDDHLAETVGHVKRLEQVFEIIDQKPQAKTCDAIMGIVKECEGLIQEYKGTAALDAALIAVAQAAEHYEISRYGTLRTWAEELGIDGAVPILEATLHEEMKADTTLTDLAVSAVNIKAEAA